MTSGKYFSLKMSPIYASLFWFEGYEKQIFFAQARETKQNLLLDTEM